jgi:hypothetical protein
VTSQSALASIPRFSSRYRNELLRATGHGLRGTTAPAYVPTVPTVSTTSSTVQTMLSVSLNHPTTQWSSWLKATYWMVHVAFHKGMFGIMQEESACRLTMFYWPVTYLILWFVSKFSSYWLFIIGNSTTHFVTLSRSLRTYGNTLCWPCPSLAKDGNIIN